MTNTETAVAPNAVTINTMARIIDSMFITSSRDYAEV
jgi:hypothetical protein